jgi:hypothetical protein
MSTVATLLLVSVFASNFALARAETPRHFSMIARKNLFPLGAIAERAMRARMAPCLRLQYQARKKNLSIIRILAFVCAIVGK